MRSGSLTVELLDLLPALALEYYGLDSLFSGTYEGVLHWIIDTGTSVLVGPALSGVLADHVMATWTPLPEIPPSWWL